MEIKKRNIFRGKFGGGEKTLGIAFYKKNLCNKRNATRSGTTSPIFVGKRRGDILKESGKGKRVSYRRETNKTKNIYMNGDQIDSAPKGEASAPIANRFWKKGKACRDFIQKKKVPTFLFGHWRVSNCSLRQAREGGGKGGVEKEGGPANILGGGFLGRVK